MNPGSVELDLLKYKVTQIRKENVMKHPVPSLFRLHLWIGSLFLLLLLFSFTSNAATVKIDFEDRPVGSQVRKEYLAKYGVRFNNGRICQPAKSTKSGSKALTHATSLMEFSPGPLIIYFDGPQSRVRLFAGLNGKPPKPIDATMQAFDKNGQALKTITKKIGPGPTPISNALEIKISQKKISEVRLEYDFAYFEVIDDLEFDDPVTLPPDNSPPIVKIVKPLPDENLHSAFFELRGTIKEDEGLLNVKVAIEPLNQAPASFYLTSFDYDDSSSPIKVYIPALGTLSEGKNKITVTATDIGNNVGSDSVTVFYFPNVSGLRKLGVYSLLNYENNWKGGIEVGGHIDPYCNFWNFMVNESGAYSVDKKASERFKDEQVTIKTVIPIPGDNLKSWDDFDMVFFFGHNNSLLAQDNGSNFEYYVINTNKPSGWEKKEAGETSPWGTTSMPFDYYASGSITNANKFPGAITYLYHEYTASLLGDPYDYGGGEPEGSLQPYKVKWNDSLGKIKYKKLGAKNLKWLILDGCQAVITASRSGSHRLLAYKALSEVHGGYHIILGHYRYEDTAYRGDLTPFALDLICGVPIQTAYFDKSPSETTSAIAAEKTPFYWATSTMVNDKWLWPMSVPSTTDTFSQRWIYQKKIKQEP